MKSQALDRLFADTVAWIAGESWLDAGPPQLRDAVEAGRALCQGKPLAQIGWLLPALCTAACGGSQEVAIPLTAAWILYDLASDILDDVQDREDKGLPWNHWPVPVAALTSTALILGGNACLARLSIPGDRLSEVLGMLARAGVTAARGQLPDPSPPTTAAYFSRIVANSGLIFAAVTRSGARLHTGRNELLRAAELYGLNVGILAQLRDDLLDLAHRDGDLARGNLTLPVRFALSQSHHPHQPRLRRLLDAQLPQTDDHRAEILQCLEEMQVGPVMIAMAQVYADRGLAALKALPGPTEPLAYFVRELNDSLVRELRRAPDSAA